MLVIKKNYEFPSGDSFVLMKYTAFSPYWTGALRSPHCLLSGPGSTTLKKIIFQNKRFSTLTNSHRSNYFHGKFLWPEKNSSKHFEKKKFPANFSGPAVPLTQTKKTLFFLALNNVINPGTAWPPFPQNSQTKPKTGSVYTQITPCSIENSWIFCMNRGSGRYCKINVDGRREEI